LLLGLVEPFSPRSESSTANMFMGESTLTSGTPGRHQRSTLAQPSRTDAIASISKVLHRHITSKDSTIERSCDDPARYDIDHYVKRHFTSFMPVTTCPAPFAAFLQTPKVSTFSAVCCLLSACLLAAVCCLLSAVCCLLSAICCLLSTVYRSRPVFPLGECDARSAR
jgi:hypothetical protein